MVIIYMNPGMFCMLLFELFVVCGKLIGGNSFNHKAAYCYHLQLSICNFGP